MKNVAPLTVSPNWQHALQAAVSSPAELLELLQLEPSLLPAAEKAAKLFPLRVPRGFVARMQLGDVNDPLLRQVLPIGVEADEVPGYGANPVDDLAANKLPGLLHKYHGRALIMLSGACAINCRYCFRRAFPYQDNLVGSTQWQAILDYLRGDDSIKEVILSGGDPLVVADKRLESMFTDLAQIEHLTQIRFHTRLPVVLPERITPALLSLFSNSPLPIVMVLHANHANELDASVAEVLQQLSAAGVRLLNQSVLLNGVNDSLEALVQLQQRLFALNVQTYYLHMLDKVQGAAHFAVSDARAQQLYAELQANLPGYMVPKLARENAGEPAKTLL
jgi:EF-P beta-lysylation protein EpmB